MNEGVKLIATLGPGCEAVHDQIDDILIYDGLGTPECLIVTTWHGDETLEEVIEFVSDFGNNGNIRQVRL
jgi:hypothetical protein